MKKSECLPIIETDRLLLRQWSEADLEPFACLNADPRVMEYFPSTLKREESDQMVKRVQAKITEGGGGLWAVFLKENGEFIGLIGLNTVDHDTFPAHFTPAVEIAWRLAFAYWGKGYATESALAVLKYGFEILGLKEIISFTPVQNQRSRRVMEKIGMHRKASDDFDDPKLPEGHPLKRQVLYRIAPK